MTAAYAPAPARGPVPAAAAAEAHDLIDTVGHQAAAAFERGGSTWAQAVPLLRGLVGDDLVAAPDVVVARALGRALGRQAAAVERDLRDGGDGGVERTAARLRAASAGLAALLDATGAGDRR